MKTQALVLTGGVLLATAPAFATGPFTWPGQVDLAPLDRELPMGQVVAEDSQGSLYRLDGSCQVAGSTEWRSFGSGPFGMAPQGDGVVGWISTPLDDGQEHVRIVQVRCADLVPGQAVDLQWKVLGSFDRKPLGPDVPGQPLLVSAQGDICHVRPAHAGVECVTFPNGKLALDVRLDVSDLDARVQYKPSVPKDKLPKDDKWQGKVPETWRVRLGTFAPDGRLFLAAERQSWVYGVDGVAYSNPAWILEIPPGPAAPVVPGQPKPLHVIENFPSIQVAMQLVWEPTLGKLAWFTTGDYSHETRAVAGGDGAGNGVAVELGAAGAGLNLLRTDDGRVAFLSLTDAIARRRVCNTKAWQAMTCESGLGVPQLWQRPDGHIGVALPYTNFIQKGNVERGMTLHALTFDAGSLDLDEDGVTAAEEATRGTSDWSEDTDGGGTIDGIEAHVAATDPLKLQDDPWQTWQRKGRFAIVRSPLISVLHDLSALVKSPPTWAETWSANGPLCLGGVCLDADGQVVATYSGPATKSVDGTVLVLATGKGWERQSLLDGQRQVVATKAEVEALLVPTSGQQAGPIRVLPVGAQTTYFAREWGGGKVAIFQTGQPGRLVFDLQKARCDSGLGPCDGHPGGKAKTELPVHDIPRDQIRLLGYVPATQRLMVGVQGVWDQYLLAVHAQDPLVVLRRGGAVGNLMHWIFPVGECDPARSQCDLLSDAGVLDPYLTGRDTWMGPLPQDVPETPQFAGAWGHTVLRIAPDVVEFVRYEPGVDPGDVLVARPVVADVGSEGVMLYVSKPRGGLVPLWNGIEHEIKGVDGMDVRADGTVCLADHQGQRLWEYGAQFDRVPSLLKLQADVGGILDCRYDAQGDLHLLFDDPPRIEIRTGTNVATVPGPALAAGKHPQSFVKKPDGSLDVLYVEEGLRARLFTRAGRKVEMPQGTQDVLLDDKPLGSFRLWWFNATTPPLPQWKGRAPLVERADGLLLLGGSHAAADLMYVVMSSTWALDPRTGRSGIPWEGSHYGNWAWAMAVVPGGVAIDPWTHRAVSDPVPQTELPPVPPAPTAPGQGKPVAQAGDASGCQAGRTARPAGASSLLVAFVLGVFVLGRVPRARRSRKRA